jgi:hypothetical protein
MRKIIVGLVILTIAAAIAGCDQGSRHEIKPKGRRQDQARTELPARPTVSILVTSARIYVGATGVPGGSWSETIDRAANATVDPAWAKLDSVLAKLKREHFADRTDLELAADADPSHPVAYQDLVTVMDHAVKAGFTDVGLTEPASLSWRPSTIR